MISKEKMHFKKVHPEGFLFDLDDTLIGSESIYLKAYEILCLDLKLFSEARDQVKITLGEGHVAARNRLLYLKKYLELMGQFSAAHLLNLNKNYEIQLQNLIQIELKKTKHIEVLRKLSSRFSLGIVTNENLRTQMIKLEKIDPDHQIFKFVVTSEEIGFEKPSPMIVSQALRHFSCSPDKVLMVGDSVNNDLIPFSQAGCSVIGTRQFRDESKENPSFQWINQLSELEECFV